MRDLSPAHSTWVIVLTYVAALALTIWPLPHWAEPFRPAWVALATIYWCLWLPERVGVISAFVAGLLLDALAGTLLGEHALALVVLAWMALWVHLQVRVFPWWQQSFTVLVMLAIYSFLLFWVDGVMGYTAGAGQRWTPVLISALLWPWVVQVLTGLQRRYQVS